MYPLLQSSQFLRYFIASTANIAFIAVSAVRVRYHRQKADISQLLEHLIVSK